jgi:ACS family glucarate transporter-like MFS transporter
MPNKRAWILVFLFFLATINYMDRVALSIAGKTIATEFNLSPIQLGYLFSSFLWTYVICLIPMGIIVDRFGTRLVNAVGITVWSLAMFLTGQAAGFGTMIASRLVMGAGESTSFPAGNRVIREWMPARDRGFAMSIFNTGSYFGPALGSLVIGSLIAMLGWRMTFYVCGGIGFIWLALWLARYHLPEQASWLGREEREMILRERNAVGDTPEEHGFRLGLKGLIGAKTLWALMLTQGCGVYTQYLFLTWLPNYLQTQKGIPLLASATLMAMPYFGTVVFAIALGRLSDRILGGDTAKGRRRLMVAAMMGLGAVVLLVPMFDSVGVILLLITIALTGQASAISLNFALLNDLLKSAADIGTATGMLVFGGNVFGLLAPIITGYVIAATGQYDLAFVIAGCLLVVGMLSSLLLARGSIGGSGGAVAPAE